MERCEFHLGTSRWLSRYVLAVHLFAVAVIWWFPVLVTLQVVSTIVVTTSLFFVMRRCSRDGAVLIVDSGQWRLQRGDDCVEVGLAPPCYVSRWLVILPLVWSNGRTFRLLVPFDSLDAEQYRRLKVQVRLSLAG